MDYILHLPLTPHKLSSNPFPTFGLQSQSATSTEPNRKIISNSMVLRSHMLDLASLRRDLDIKLTLEKYGVPKKICVILASKSFVSCSEITNFVAQYYETTKQFNRIFDLPTLFSQLRSIGGRVGVSNRVEESFAFQEGEAQPYIIRDSGIEPYRPDWALHTMRAQYMIRSYFGRRDDDFNWKDCYIKWKARYLRGSSRDDNSSDFSPLYLSLRSYSYEFDPSSASTNHSGLENFSVSEQLRKPQKESSEEEGFCENAWAYGLGSNIILSKASVLEPFTAIGAAASVNSFTLSKTLMLMLAMGLLAANIPLGMWRQHTKRFSPSWLIAALATAPFLIPMLLLCNPTFMPKPIMLLAFGMSVLVGQGIGSMLEKYRLGYIPRLASLFASLRLEASIPLPDHLIELDFSSLKKSLRVTSIGAKGITPASSQPMLKQILWAVSMAAKCMWRQRAHGLSNWAFTPQNTALTLGMWLFRIIKYISDTRSNETPLRIKVSVSSWSCLILEVAPGKYSIEVSQEHALPPPSSPAPL